MENDVKEKLYRVVDLACTEVYKTRTHTIRINGDDRVFTFKHGEDMKLPLHEALKFNIPGFKVYDLETDAEIAPPMQVEEDILSKLAPDQVIATLEELSEGALKVRAAKLRGGEVYLDDEVHRDAVIEFLKAPENAPRVLKIKKVEPRAPIDVSKIEEGNISGGKIEFDPENILEV
jgi:hypothetical protein